MADMKTAKSSWAPLQIRNDAREALDNVRTLDYPTKKSYSDVLLALIDEHNHDRDKRGDKHISNHNEHNSNHRT